MGWSGPEGQRTLLFRNNGRRIVIDAGARHIDSESSGRRSGVHRFIARDGSLLFMRRWGQELAKNVGDRMPIYAMPALSL